MINNGDKRVGTRIIGFVLFMAPFWFLFLSQNMMGEPSANAQLIRDSVRLTYVQKIEAAFDNKELLIDTYYQYGEYLDEEEGLYEASIEQFITALDIAQAINQDDKTAAVANYLAYLYCVLGDFSKSIEAYDLALESANRMQDYHEMAKISMNIAGTYSFMGNYKEAIDYALKAVNIKETNDDLVRICYHYITLGNIFRENGNMVKWKEYVLKAYAVKDVPGCASFDDVAKIYNCLGGIAKQEGDQGKALQYYDTLMVLSQDVEYSQGISTALTNSAQIYYDLGQVSKALALTEEAEKYFGGDTYEIIFSNNWKAELYKELGEKEKALALVLENIQREDIQYYYAEKIKCLGLLYELNFSLNHYHEAYRWNDSLRTAESRMQTEDTRRVVEELETQYETVKKEKHIELLTVENELKSQRLRTGLVVILILIIIIALIIYILQMKRRQADLEKNDLQQKVLRAQMNPHFIFNVLSSIQYYMLANDAKKASGYLSSLALLMRSTLEFSTSETISLDKELAMLRSYVELEQMRMPDQFSFQLKAEGLTDSESILIPPMMIQPFVENAIKHGFQGIKYKGALIISVSFLADFVEFIIEDNGIGMEDKACADTTHRSMAMAIFEERRKLIKQKHKRHFAFEVVNLSDENPELSGVRVKISVPVFDISSQ